MLSKQYPIALFNLKALPYSGSPALHSRGGGKGIFWRLAPPSSAAYSWQIVAHMPPPNRQPWTSRSRSRENAAGRTSSAPPLTTYRSATFASRPRPRTLCTTRICHDCHCPRPSQELRTIETRCCEYHGAHTGSLELCPDCFSVSWDRFVMESGPMSNLTETQISRGFSIWKHHDNHR